MCISSRLKYLRAQFKISQAKLAKQITVSSGNVGDWETGKSKPGADALIALSKYFDVSIDWILTGIGRGPKISENSYEELYDAPKDGEPGVNLLPENAIITQAIIGPNSLSFRYEVRESYDEESIEKSEWIKSQVIWLSDHIKHHSIESQIKNLESKGIFSEDENNCLHLYNELNERNKGKIIDRMEVLIDEQKALEMRQTSSTLTSGEEAAALERGTA